METITLGAGCFWCVEAIFKSLKGIVSVKPGYCGGTIEKPTYEQVYTGTTGHAEVCQVVYDENIISFEEILEVYFKTHDPTSLNQQGDEDIGTQYRSVIFYHSEKQRSTAVSIIKMLNNEEVYTNPVVTEITPIENFYEAEAYHHNYLELNPENQYCQRVVIPKIEKFKAVFRNKLKGVSE
ncbi:MAG: peptide-methionine (S)-S-oxide reductase MsrA [Bacteroidales bacterium]|nr:peptide-methionine (S)-S-oxide reductase MsrA [Bacteroidales bacterium]MBN2821291.1 peptide-methionine (S)-S-oxide reductase MsrA [Bacteroidales bacterium]